jgi:Peptidase family M23
MPTPWYQYNRIDNYALFPDPFGSFPKPDSNLAVPDGQAITALASGVISGINAPDGSVPAFGEVVTVKLDNPINPVATHTAYLHLGSLPSGLAVGQRVQQGDTIGYAGPTAQGDKITGFALYNGDYYGYGPSWAQFVGSPALNPVPFLDAVKNGQSQSTSQLAGGTVGASTLTGDAVSSFLSPYIGSAETSVTSGLQTGMLVAIALVAIVAGLFLLIAGTPLGEHIKQGAIKTVEEGAMV